MLLIGWISTVGICLKHEREGLKQHSLFEADEETKQGMVSHLRDALGWPEEEAMEFVMEIGRQTALAHIMRVLYLKRLESSVQALLISFRRLRDFLGCLEQGTPIESRRLHPVVASRGFLG